MNKSLKILMLLILPVCFLLLTARGAFASASLEEPSYVESADEAQGGTLKEEGTSPHTSAVSEASSPVSATVSFASGRYVLNIGDECRTSDRPSELIACLPPECELTFLGISTNEPLYFPSYVKLSGSLTASQPITIAAGAELSGVRLSLVRTELRINGGTVVFSDGEITIEGEGAVLLDSSSEARLEIKGGSIAKYGDGAAIISRLGTLSVFGGSVRSEYGFAIENSSTLYLFGNPIISGRGADVLTSRPIRLSCGGVSLSSAVSVRLSYQTACGGFYPVFLDARGVGSELLSLFGSGGEELPLTYFEESRYTSEHSLYACYKPFISEFFLGDEVLARVEHIFGEIITPPIPDVPLGYTFSGWVDEEGGSPSFAEPIGAGMVYRAELALVAPEFSLSGINAVYSPDGVRLGFDWLSHPLLSEGEVNVVWQRDGEELLASGCEIRLFLPSESGKYSARITFTHNENSVTVQTPGVDVVISKMDIPVPYIDDILYTGDYLSPVIEESQYYSVTLPSVRDAGRYSVLLTVNEPQLYTFGGNSTLSVCFSVLPGENSFTVPFSIKDGYVGSPIQYSASARFGTVRILYSQNGIDYSETPPSDIGDYYAIAIVEGTENFGALRSEPQRFSLKEEVAVSIKIEKMPNKTAYRAFERPDLSGAEFIITYNSGRWERIGHSAVTCEISEGNEVLVVGSSLYARYGSVRVSVPIGISPAEYDLSGILFFDTVVVYNGERHTVSASGEVVGKDGIALSYSVFGGGIECGTYKVTLSFACDSKNYLRPQPITRTLTIRAAELTVVWGEVEFIYDGEAKAPVAYAETDFGLRLYPTVTGGGTDAGIYTVSAAINNPNYVLLGASTTMEIKKRDIDVSGIVWSKGELNYNGKAQSVKLSRLPRGTFSVGYTGATFTDAGEYTAYAVFSYDEKNYNAPTEVSYKWRILPIEYDLSGMKLLDTEVIYDGSVHYPEITGAVTPGFDGSLPSFTFSRGAVNVSEGRVAVTLTFYTASKNYVTPRPMCAYVSILPKGIEVTWSQERFVYSGEYRIPEAYSAVCGITVGGGGRDAGEYVAVATSTDSNYTVLNPKCAFVIEKCPNEWIRVPTALDIYESGDVRLFGDSLYGEAVFTVYSDPSLTAAVNGRLTPGVYYAVARVAEGKNYLALTSPVISFSVVAVVPVRLEISLAEDARLVALGSLDKGQLIAAYVNNDGTRVSLSEDDLTVEYSNGECLYASDTHVTVKALGMELLLPISVSRARYDTSGMHWVNNHATYNGAPITAELVGLPEGVEILRYVMNSATDAGSYQLLCELTYDKENYYPPEVPVAWLVIKPRVIPYPEVPDLVYNGQRQMPMIESSEYYTASAELGCAAGEYRVVLALADSLNFRFDGAAEITYRILPSPISVTVNGGGKSYTVTQGEIYSGDSLGEEYYTERGLVYLRSSNPNYAVVVTPADARVPLSSWLWIVILAIILLFCAAVAIKERARIALALGICGGGSAKTAEVEKEAPELPVLDKLLSVDVEHAESLISDLVARSLITESEERVSTSGHTRAVVNIDTLSAIFDAGAKIDINDMKAKGIVREDARYVKVLARGVIDKPLKIMANSFSIAAVKMIALTGGEAIKISSRKNQL